MLAGLRAAGFDVATRNHAEAILNHDFSTDLAALVAALLSFRIGLAELIGGGGGESGQTQRLRHMLTQSGWRKHKFTVQTIVDGREREAISHEVDHVRFAPSGGLALEIEWNNKDPFFDRDLQNFRSLHDVGAISAGIILTRGPGMQDALAATYMDAYERKPEEDIKSIITAWKSASQREQLRQMSLEDAASWLANKAFQSKYGQATTHWSKLVDRIDRGLGDPCPLILIGVTDKRLVD